VAVSGSAALDDQHRDTTAVTRIIRWVKPRSEPSKFSAFLRYYTLVAAIAVACHFAAVVRLLTAGAALPPD